MKHAGSVRGLTARKTNPPGQMTSTIFLLLCLSSVCTSLTPPRIIYGGWTPILPGHPFYFGPVRRRNVEPQHHQGYHHHPHHEQDPQIHQQIHPQIRPVQHDVEHHFEQHVQFAPGQFDARQHQREVQYPYSSAGPRPHHQTYEDQGPVRHYAKNAGKETYSQFPPQSAYEEGPGDAPPQELGKDVYTQSHYAYEQEVPVGKTQQFSSDHKTNKNIFAYYPPQSAYDAPKPHEDLDYKPVYLEEPRKSPNVLENPHQFVPYILPSLKEGPLKTLSIQDLNSLGHLGDEKTYLKITPLGNVDPGELKHLGQINLDEIQFLGPSPVKPQKYSTVIKDLPTYPVIKDSPGGIPTYPVIKDSSGGTPRYPVIKDSSVGTPRYPVIKDSSGGTPRYPPPAQYSSLTYGPGTKLNYGTVGELPYKVIGPTVYKSVNNYKGSEFSLGNNYRPLNPIETKKYRNSRPRGFPKAANNYDDLSHIAKSPVYPSKPELYIPPTKTLGKPLRINKNVLSPTLLGKNIATQVRNYMGPKLVRPFYPKTILPGPVVPYRPLPKTLVHLPLLRTQSLPGYLPKNAKLHSLYKDPGVLANIRGSPALVEREVAIIHLPVRTQPDYPDGKEYLYFTASTPESTQILDLNGSVPLVTLGNKKHHHAPLFAGNESSYAFGHEKAGDSSEEIEDNSVAGHHRRPPQDEFQYIFVSSSGVHPDGEDSSRDHRQEAAARKQFFHAYYAPADHRPPEGYVKMTVREFNNLFRNAEIRYVDKDPLQEDNSAS